MSVHVHVVTPVFPTGLTQDSHFENILDKDDLVTFTELEAGPASVESALDVALAAPETIARAVEAEDRGAQAVVIDCMEEPGLAAARECVTIPVLGPCQTSMAVASTLGRRFSMLAVIPHMEVSFEQKARVYGSAEKYASTRSVDIPVQYLLDDEARLGNALFDQSLAAINEDGADTLILACTGMIGVASQLQSRLADAGFDVPVIDPIVVTIRMAKVFAQSGLHHSGISSPKPAMKERRGYSHAALQRFSDKP